MRTVKIYSLKQLNIHIIHVVLVQKEKKGGNVLRGILLYLGRRNSKLFGVSCLGLHSHPVSPSTLPIPCSLQ